MHPSEHATCVAPYQPTRDPASSAPWPIHTDARASHTHPRIQHRAGPGPFPIATYSHAPAAHVTANAAPPADAHPTPAPASNARQAPTRVPLQPAATSPPTHRHHQASANANAHPVPDSNARRAPPPIPLPLAAMPQPPPSRRTRRHRSPRHRPHLTPQSYPLDQGQPRLTVL